MRKFVAHILLLLVLVLVSGCENQIYETNAKPENASPTGLEEDLSARHWVAPSSPADVVGARGPRMAVLSAPWCQWCMVLEAEVLPSAAVQKALAGRFELAEVDVDRNPEWMALPGIEGLPSVVFFNRDGDHVLTRSGFRSPPQMVALLEAVDIGLSRGEMLPYAPRPISHLGDETLDAEDAASLLAGLEAQLFMKVNGNEGGFNSPSRDPKPKLLWELQQWSELDAPARVARWVELTLRGANRGSSPAQRAEPLPDMDFAQTELVSLSAEGAKAGKRWRVGIDTLPTKDPYLGLRDPVDGGFFRYAAGPGWYHPHFERFADQNLAWVLLLRATGGDADKTARFLEDTFHRADGWLNASQASDPFYYRLAAENRSSSPPVSQNAELEVQAWAARVDDSRCAAFAAALGTRWPLARFADPEAPRATPDAVGEALIALNACGADASELAKAAESAWRQGLPRDARLHRLAAGLCAADRPLCGAALAQAGAIRVDVAFAPPLLALARYRPH